MLKCNKIFIDSIYFYCHIHRDVCVYVGDYKSRDQCEMIAKATEEIAAGGLEDGNRIFYHFHPNVCLRRSVRREREMENEVKVEFIGRRGLKS